MDNLNNINHNNEENVSNIQLNKIKPLDELFTGSSQFRSTYTNDDQGLRKSQPLTLKRTK